MGLEKLCKQNMPGNHSRKLETVFQAFYSDIQRDVLTSHTFLLKRSAHVGKAFGQMESQITQCINAKIK